MNTVCIIIMLIALHRTFQLKILPHKVVHIASSRSLNLVTLQGPLPYRPTVPPSPIGPQCPLPYRPTVPPSPIGPQCPHIPNLPTAHASTQDTAAHNCPKLPPTDQDLTQ